MMQAQRGRNLSGKNALGVARTASENARRILAGGNEGRHTVGVRRENNGGRGIFRPMGKEVEAMALDRHTLDREVHGGQVMFEEVNDRSLVAGSAFDVDQLPGQGDEIHGGENTRSGNDCGGTVGCAWQSRKLAYVSLSHPGEPSLTGEPDAGGTWGTKKGWGDSSSSPTLANCGKCGPPEQEGWSTRRHPKNYPTLTKNWRTWGTIKFTFATSSNRQPCLDAFSLVSVPILMP